MRNGLVGIRAACAALVLTLASTAALPQTAYKYKDSNGQWVFTDAAPTAAARENSFNLERHDDTLHLAMERRDSGRSTQLVAVNDCLCAVTFRLKILQSDDPAIAAGSEYRALLAPGTQHPLVRLEHSGADHAQWRYTWRYALGSPDAAHNPPLPYRAPFAIGSSFMVSQAYPSRFTHTTPDSEYAVDIAVPDGTPLYAARAGVVIEVRRDAFREGLLSTVMLDQANFIEILHDDGTIAVYAHLHWDSIRVHIGDRVSRGLYIANSGNTGFTSGPHLHFAVFRNDGLSDVSVPIQFTGSGGVGVSPVTRQPLTAY